MKPQYPVRMSILIFVVDPLLLEQIKTRFLILSVDCYEPEITSEPNLLFETPAGLEPASPHQPPQNELECMVLYPIELWGFLFKNHLRVAFYLNCP